MTYWFDRSPGQTVVSNADVSRPGQDPELDDHMMLIGADAPDWIRAPAELGGDKLRVKTIFGGPCPMCYSDTEDESAVRTYDFEGSDFFCAECLQGHGFVWYKLREPTCDATKDSFTCSLEPDHEGDHKDEDPSGGCVGWPNRNDDATGIRDKGES